MTQSWKVRCGLLAVLVMILGATVIDARGGSVETGKDGETIITIKLAQGVFPDQTRNDAATQSEIAVVKEFRKRFVQIFTDKYREKYEANPEKYGRINWDNLKIQLEPFSGITVENVETDLLGIAGGLSADVIYVNFRKSNNYIQNSFLYPLDNPEDNYFESLLKPKTDEKQELKDRMKNPDRIHDRIWQVFQRKGPDGVKRIWALPFGDPLGKILLYRKDLFDEHEIDYPDENWTWEDMLAACKKMTDPEKDTYGIRLGRGKHEAWFWIAFLWSAGGEAMVYNEDTDTWKCVFDSREAAVALEFYTRLSTEKWIDKNGKIRRGYAFKDAKAGKKWEDGKIGMNLSYYWEQLGSRINPEQIGLAPLPLGYEFERDGKKIRIRGGELNSRMMGLFADIKSPVVRDAAWEYMKFYGSKDAVEVRTRYMVDAGMGRFVLPNTSANTDIRKSYAWRRPAGKMSSKYLSKQACPNHSEKAATSHTPS